MARSTAPSRKNCFNPRPPRKVGATLFLLVHPHPSFLFQSSPTPKGGRYSTSASLGISGLMFQSSPTPKGGRYLARCGVVAVVVVSILAHPERWALRPRPRAPHPLPRVSILAHPERWALLQIAVARYSQRPLFQSSPTPKGGRYPISRFCQTHLDVFQSSPTPKGGRYQESKPLHI